MISLTGEYALRALVFLARHRDEWPTSGKRIAEEARIPHKYLSAILADLVRSGLLEGTRGKNGGFRLTRPATEIHLAEILQPFEPVAAHRNACPFGNAVCSDLDPCGAHERWKAVKAALDGFLSDMTLQAVAGRRDEERRRKGRSRKAT